MSILELATELVMGWQAKGEASGEKEGEKERET
jgi:hypothetical protein